MSTKYKRILNTFYVSSITLIPKPGTYICCAVLSRYIRVRLFCNPMDWSPTGFSVHGIFQARILEWVAIPYPTGSSWPSNQTHVSSIFCTGRQILYSRVPSNLYWITPSLMFYRESSLFPSYRYSFTPEPARASVWELRSIIACSFTAAASLLSLELCSSFHVLTHC